MAKARFVANKPDLTKILQREGLKAARKVGKDILSKVGTQHYEMDDYVGATRGRVSVRTKAVGVSMGHEAKHHDLIRALGASGQESAPDPNEKIEYTNSRGRTSMRTRADVANYTRNRRG